MDLVILLKVLRMVTQEYKCPAIVTGHRCTLWEYYPALLDGLPGGEVCGMAYKFSRFMRQAIYKLTRQIIIE